MEVVSDAENPSLVLLDAFDLVGPLAGNLDGSLGGLDTSVHRQDHVVAKDLANLLCPLGEDIVVKSAGAQGQAAGLLSQSFDELGVAVTLVDSTVSGKEVEVLVAFGVPDVDALSLGEDDRQRMVVVSSVLGLSGNGGVRGRGVVARVVGCGGRGARLCVGSHVGELFASIKGPCGRFWCSICTVLYNDSQMR